MVGARAGLPLVCRPTYAGFSVCIWWIRLYKIWVTGSSLRSSQSRGGGGSDVVTMLPEEGGSRHIYILFYFLNRINIIKSIFIYALSIFIFGKFVTVRHHFKRDCWVFFL